MYQVMIIDDEKMVVNSLALGFDWKSCGFEVVGTATDSLKALQMISFIRPDVIFTDIQMPGISGIELIQRAHAASPFTKFIIISGHADFEYARQSIALGVLGYLLKPINVEEVTELLENASDILDAQQSIVASAFSRMLHTPGHETASAFLSGLSNGLELQEHMCVAVCAGTAASLLSGNVCYTAVPVNEDCELYFISSNSEYLGSLSFNTALLGAASDHTLRSFAYIRTDAPLEFLEEHLLQLINAAFAQFIDPCTAVIGPVELPSSAQPSPAADEFVEALATAANRNRVVEVLDLLAEFGPRQRGACTMDHAIRIYNYCTSLLCRVQNEDYDQLIRFAFELAQLYGSLDEMLEALAQQLSHQNTSSMDTDRIHNEILRKVIDYLNRNFMQTVSFQQICADNCINPSYLSQLFRKELGMTFTSYIRTLRLAYAKELLATTNLRIQEIAEKTGYEYSFNFTKLFKKEVGVTPKQYRDANRKRG